MNISKDQYQSISTSDNGKFANQTKKIKAEEFDDLQDDSKKEWVTLPQSVIGTLLYFLLIEQNNPNFDLFHTIKSLILIGLPVFVTYVMQFIMIYGLWESIYYPGEDGDDSQMIEASKLCIIDIKVLFSAIAVYWISLGPSYLYLFQQMDIVLFCKRVAYTQDADDGDIYVTNILATTSKRIFIFIFVNLIEIILVLALSYVGVGYLLSSQGIQNVLMNSVSVCFIMQIDDMARDAFQPSSISDHIDGMVFESSTSTHEDDKSVQGLIRPPTWATYKTFWSVGKVIFLFILTSACLIPVLYHMCSDF